MTTFQKSDLRLKTGDGEFAVHEGPAAELGVGSWLYETERLVESRYHLQTLEAFSKACGLLRRVVEQWPQGNTVGAVMLAKEVGVFLHKTTVQEPPSVPAKGLYRQEIEDARRGVGKYTSIQELIRGKGLLLDDPPKPLPAPRGSIEQRAVALLEVVRGRLVNAVIPSGLAEQIDTLLHEHVSLEAFRHDE